jgi:hypothetical protein
LKTEKLILISISKDGNTPSQIVKIRGKKEQALLGIEGLRAKVRGSAGQLVNSPVGEETKRK